MKTQFTNQLMSSFLMYLDNTLLTKGEGFHNLSGFFYQTTSTYNNYYAYSSPYSQLVYDQGVRNTIPFTGVYLDSTFIGTGQSGLFNIDYRKGTVYFTGEIAGANRISGSFSSSEFSTHFTTEPEYRIIFETKKVLRSKYNQTPTGLSYNEINFPSIFVKENGGYSDPYAFGGEDLTVSQLRLIVLGDSQYNTDAVTSILKDCTRDYVPLLHNNEFPFNAYGGLKNTPFNYTGVTNGRIGQGSGVFIDKVQIISMTQGFRGDLQNLQPAVFPAIVDVTLSIPRMARL